MGFFFPVWERVLLPDVCGSAAFLPLSRLGIVFGVGCAVLDLAWISPGSRPSHHPPAAAVRVVLLVFCCLCAAATAWLLPHCNWIF